MTTAAPPRRVALGPWLLGLAAACLVLLASADASGWLVHGARPAGMATLAWALLFLAGWTLMTGAMMLPSSLPFLRAMQRLGGASAAAAAASAFTLAWCVLGLLMWALLWLLGDALSRLAPGGAERLGGASLLVAAAYQASPLAKACQRACARPFAILARHWRGGTAPTLHALRAGAHYGATCIGCCVPMVVVMFIVGMNDLLWMLALALLMLAQKHPRLGPQLALPGAAVLALAGLAIALQWWTPPLHTLRALCGV